MGATQSLCALTEIHSDGSDSAINFWLFDQPSILSFSDLFWQTSVDVFECDFPFVSIKRH